MMRADARGGVAALTLSCLYVVGVTALVYSLFWNWGYDDPFITYRYADNLERGIGFVYNPGERVLSTTTPLFALTLALFGSLWHDLPSLATLLGAVGTAASGLCFYLLARRWGAPVVGWTGLVLYPTFPLVLLTLGSETPVYLALCLGAFVALAYDRYAGSALLVGLATLARPDGVLVAVVLAARHVWMRRPVPWRAVGLFLLTVLPWFIFAWFYFGSPLPVTLLVKQHQGAMAISTPFAPGLLTVARWFAEWHYVLEIVLIALAAYSARRMGEWALILAWTALYFIAYTLLGVTSYFWYYAPLVPGLLVLVGWGVMSAREIVVAGLYRVRGSRPTLRVIRVALPGVLLVLLMGWQWGDDWRLAQLPDRRIEPYTAIGRWLAENTREDATVGALEVGIIGYHARRPMVDFGGLVQPGLAAQFNRETTYEDAALTALGQYRPDYVVLENATMPRAEEELLRTLCTAVQAFGDGVSPGWSIYECRW